MKTSIKTFLPVAFILSAAALTGCNSVDKTLTSSITPQAIAANSVSPKAVSRLGTSMTPLGYSQFNLVRLDEQYRQIEQSKQKTSLLGYSKIETSSNAASAVLNTPKVTRVNTANLGPRVKTTYHLPNATAEVEQLIGQYASAYNVPERLVRRVVLRESGGNPQARNGPYWGLMQISHPTAQSMGYNGHAQGLLDAETNLRYAVKYLAGAYLVADGDESRAVRLYARGFYYDAKAKGVLEHTGLRPGPLSIATAYAAQ
ncbi:MULTISPECIES: lytic transglycosylase domain-containing protein [unclassified Bartonella]|uniref:lytic transglycosylase domain-containing protein n=1 Tax=unclassified Bartonella TaxID=2645622 RepID=UPI0029056BBD|nr:MULTISPECIES: lytic transglycosylase domain-containing protein [unclassified Bartonella]